MKVVILLTAVAAVATTPQYGAPANADVYDPQDPPKYEFEYAVRHHAADYGQREARDGPSTAGSYEVRLPDTRLQRVVYSVDGDSGFRADVEFDGQAQHPAEYGRGLAGKSAAVGRRYEPPPQSRRHSAVPRQNYAPAEPQPSYRPAPSKPKISYSTAAPSPDVKSTHSPSLESAHLSASNSAPREPSVYVDSKLRFSRVPSDVYDKPLFRSDYERVVHRRGGSNRRRPESVAPPRYGPQAVLIGSDDDKFIIPDTEQIPGLQRLFSGPWISYQKAQDSYLANKKGNDKQAYGAPDVTYGGPEEESYEAPKESYGASKESYGAPEESYGAPAESYGAPKESYGAPNESYGAPNESYGAPRGSYDSSDRSFVPYGARIAPKQSASRPSGGDYPSYKTVQ